MINLQRAIPVVERSGRDWFYHARLSRIRGARVSGVYVILDRTTRRVLYVGESHTGRLYDTLTRHFRAWRPKSRDSGGGRRGGTTYERRDCLVAWSVTADDVAVARQFDEIARLEPRDNDLVPVTDDVPI